MATCCNPNTRNGRGTPVVVVAGDDDDGTDAEVDSEEADADDEADVAAAADRWGRSSQEAKPRRKPEVVPPAVVGLVRFAPQWWLRIRSEVGAASTQRFAQPKTHAILD